jgi:hypothetical protein
VSIVLERPGYRRKRGFCLVNECAASAKYISRPLGAGIRSCVQFKAAVQRGQSGHMANMAQSRHLLIDARDGRCGRA